MKNSHSAILLSTLLFGSACTEALDEGTAESASHSWGNYHWARTADNFPLQLIDSVTSQWDSYLGKAASDWSTSQRLDFVLQAGDESSKTRRGCSAPDGMVRVCNLEYGNNGWLGIAGISLDSNGHIVRGYTKLNDTYFASAYYNKPEWRQMVTCQEIGHDIGLGHQDEDFDNVSLKSCMDYQDPPWPDPNAHDYDQLDTIYAHLDSYNSYATGGGGGGGDTGCNAPPGKGCNKDNNKQPSWGSSLYRRGQIETFSKKNPDGTTEITTVTWASGH